MIKKFVVVYMVLLISFVQFGQVSAAGVELNSPQTYEMSLSNTNISLSGGRASKELLFQVPDYWDVNNVKFNMDYKVSPLTMNDRSSVTLKINGTYLHSFRPSITNDVQQRLTVTIPKALIINGSNALSIEGDIQTTDINDDVCINDDEQENWLQIFSTSSIAIGHTNMALDGSISGFNEYFTGIDVVRANQSAIVVPEESDSSELETAIYALTGFTKTNSLDDKVIPILTYGTASLKSKKAVVMVSLHDHLPDQLKGLLIQQDLNNAALIQLVNTDQQPTLVVTSKNADLLVKAGRLIANQALMGQLDSETKVVTSDTDVEKPITSVNKTVTLTDNGDQLKGWRHQEKSYFITLPSNRSIAGASKISMDFRYAKNLDFDRSMVTILVNDTPIGSKKLTTELADGDTLTLPIPKNLNVSGNFSLTVAFDLEMVNDGCYRKDNQMPWAFITKDTILKLNTTENMDLLFNNYPYPFIRDGSFNRVAVVMPSERDNYTYQSLSNLFNLLGRYVEGNTGELHFYEDKVGESDLSDRNIIAIGTYQNNKVIREHNNSLYFQYGADGTGFKSNEKVSIDVDYGKRMGTLQLLQSPYESGHGFMAVTGASSEYYYLASKLVAIQGGIWKIYGDGVTTDKDSNIHSYRFKKEVSPEQSTFLDNVVQRGDILGYMVASILVLLLVLVSLILIIRKYKSRGGRR
ncbi:cellulose biosynthesis cyclic di-GMP-binding regulatory protein BcsB [Paenibacillus glacialis]|uniref:Cellulose synthase n=1 Tax=Paenibacillus glacialis TaxID=494026 RepID=A0A168LGJ9_9BACL|nr:cellulose biosynthesis cyclic di-GMP-binding regulatory protein BcsB [Paenibacillus glacialis]OAB43362.1 cellulose synthase [Paenibacillus glacialis]